MSRSWIVAIVVGLVLVAAYAVVSSPPFDKPSDVGEGADLKYDLSYDDGEFALVVRNAGDETEKLEFMTSEHLRIILKKGEEEVFNSAEGMMFTQQVNYEELEPGAQKTYTVQWQDAQEGMYTVEAYLLAISDSDPVAATDLTVE